VVVVMKYYIWLPRNCSLGEGAGESPVP